MQQMTEYAKEMNAIKASLSTHKKGGSVKQATPTIDPEKMKNVSQRLTQNEDNLAKLFKENKQLNAYLGNFQKEIVDSHKEICNELLTLRTARTARGDSLRGSLSDFKAPESQTKSSNDP